LSPDCSLSTHAFHVSINTKLWNLYIGRCSCCSTVFSGFEAVLVNSGEVRQPQRVIPFALIVALSASVVLFLLIPGCVHWCVTKSWEFGTTAGRCKSNFPRLCWAGDHVSWRACISLRNFECNHAGVYASAVCNGGARTTAGATCTSAQAISHATCFDTDLCGHHAILALSGTFIYAVKVSVVTRVIVYASTCAALPILRRRDRAPFEVPGGSFISIACVALCVWLLVNSGWREARDVLIAIVIGLVIYALTRFSKDQLTKRTGARFAHFMLLPSSRRCCFPTCARSSY
jgi:amino acid transporter